MIDLKAFTAPITYGTRQPIDLGKLFHQPMVEVSPEQLKALVAQCAPQKGVIYSFDIDGTLTTNYQLDLSVVGPFLLGIDGYVVINTGRSLSSLLKTLVDLPSSYLQGKDLSKLFLLGNNGSSFAYFKLVQLNHYQVKAYSVRSFPEQVLQLFNNLQRVEYSQINRSDVSHIRLALPQPVTQLQQFVAREPIYEFIEKNSNGIFKYKDLSKGETLALLGRSCKLVHFGDSWNDLSTLNKVDLLVSVRASNLTPPFRVKAQQEADRTTLVLHSPFGFQGVLAVFESGCLDSLLESTS